MIRVLVAIGLAAAVGLAVAFLGKASLVVSVTATVAVYGAALSSLQMLSDRYDLRAKFGSTPWRGPDEEAEVLVRLYNRGRRPVRVETAGLAANKSDDPLEYPYWWGTIPPRVQDNPLGVTLDERSPAIELVAFPRQVADHYAQFWEDAPQWLFARLGHGAMTWWRLPERERSVFAEVWSQAQATQAKLEFRRGVGIPDEVDDSGNPPPH